MISTERLYITPLSYYELTDYVFGRKGSVVSDEDEDWTINNVLIPMSNADVEDHVYYTFWVARRIDGTIVGDIGFKGIPNIYGITEVGYHVFEAHRNKGYATEMVGGLTKWLEEDERTVFAAAVVDPMNTASKKVLSNNGFRLVYSTDNYVTLLKQVKF